MTVSPACRRRLVLSFRLRLKIVAKRHQRRALPLGGEVLTSFVRKPPRAVVSVMLQAFMRLYADGYLAQPSLKGKLSDQIPECTLVDQFPN